MVNQTFDLHLIIKEIVVSYSLLAELDEKIHTISHVCMVNKKLQLAR